MKDHREEIERIKNLPASKIKDQVIELMATKEYQIFSRTIYPIDRIKYIYQFNQKALYEYINLWETPDISLIEDKGTEKRYEVLLTCMTYIYNFISSQFSLVDIVEEHTKSFHFPNDKERPSFINLLQSEGKKFKNSDVFQFIERLRNNIVHEVNFAVSLKFKGEWGSCKIIYPKAEFEKSSNWGKSAKYLSRFEDEIILQDVVVDSHQEVMKYISNYEIMLYSKVPFFKEVLEKLLMYSSKYNEIGEQGFMPISAESIKHKLVLCK